MLFQRKRQDCGSFIASNVITKKVGDGNVKDAGTFTPGHVTNCDADTFNPPAITPSDASCSNGANPTFQWQVKPDMSGSWQDIQGATNKSYNPPAQNIGSKWFRRLAICPCETKATTNILHFITSPFFSDLHI